MKSNRFEEFVTINGVKVKNPSYVGEWPKEGEIVKRGGVEYRVGPNRNFIRVTPKPNKRNG